MQTGVPDFIALFKTLILLDTSQDATNELPLDGSVIAKALTTVFNSTNWSEVLDTFVVDLEASQQSRPVYPKSAGLTIFYNLLAGLDESNILLDEFFNKKFSHNLSLHIVQQSLHMDSTFFNISTLKVDKVITKDNIKALPHFNSTVTEMEKELLNLESFSNLFLETTCSTMEDAALLDECVKLQPELILWGAIKTPKPRKPVIERIITQLFELSITLPDSSLIFYRFSQIDLEMMTHCINNIYNVDISMRLASILVDSKCVDVFLDECTIFPNAIDIATQASKISVMRKYQQSQPGLAHWDGFESYLSKTFQKSGSVAILQTLHFLRSKATNECSLSPSNSMQRNLDVQSVYTIIKVASAQSSPAPEVVETLASVQAECLQAYPRLINFGYGHDDAILLHGSTNSFSPEIESKMKLCYQRMYNRAIQIRDVIDMLQRLKVSDSPDDQDVFACMIHSLLDEYRFFPEYPIEALATTSVLFGSLISFRLIEGTALSIALKFILESCRQPPDSNMFKFSVQALFAFSRRFNEFPKYCSILLQIPSLSTQPGLHQLVKDVISGTATSELSNVRGETSNPHQGPTTSVNPFKSLFISNIILNDCPQEDPTEDIHDRVLFLVNNMSLNTLPEKSKELKDILKKQYFKWFALYIVGQRARLEPNNHELYVQVVESIRSKLLEQHVLNVTYGQIIQLLGKTDLSDSATERSHLKNLGAWLGNLTLARDKPIRYQNIAIKNLLVEAYNTSRLVTVIPFVSKILNNCASSKVFKPPNPWLLGILQVLKELYDNAELKLNLTFEIEVLCNTLNIDLNDIEASHLVRDSSASDSIVTDLAKLDIDQIQPSSFTMITDSTISQDNADLLRLQQLQQAQLTQQRNVPQTINPQVTRVPQVEDEVSVPTGGLNTEQLLALNGTGEVPFSSLVGDSPFVTNPALKRLFQMTIIKSVREILPPAVERSVGIAIVSARFLVLKDFALEVDDFKLRKAAFAIVRELAETLALATSRDPLKESIVLNLRSAMVANGFGEQNFPVEEVSMAIRDNINLISNVIEKAAGAKAVQDIEEILVQSITIRRRHREMQPNQQFYSPQLTSKYPLQLLDPLGLKLGGLTPQQFSLYENFGRQRISSSTQPDMLTLGATSGTTIVPHELITANTADIPTPRAIGSSFGPENAIRGSPSVLTANLMLEQASVYIQTLIESLVTLTLDSQEKSLIDIVDGHRIKGLLSQIINQCNKLQAREQITLKAAQFTVNGLFTNSESQLARETLVFLLEKLCSISPLTNREVNSWFVHSADERKFNALVISSLIKVGMISASEFDLNLSKRISDASEMVIKFTIDLIRECVLRDTPCAFRSDFIAGLDALRDLLNIENYALQGEIRELFALLDESPVPSLSYSGSVEEQIIYIFAEWTKLNQHPAVTDQHLLVFVNQLAEHNILNDNEYLTIFFRVATEMAIESYRKDVITDREFSDDSYDTFDALARLIVIIVKLQDTNDSKKKISYLRTITTVVSLVLANEHEIHGTTFNEKPFFRIFSSILCEWNARLSKKTEFKDSEDDSRLDAEFYKFMAVFLNSLQPLLFPGFTFAWITLISHRMFLPLLLDLPNSKGWPLFVNLLISLLKFQRTHIKGKNYSEAISVIYKGTVRVFLLILHDYPELFVKHHYQLCIVMPPSFIQLRNLVLSAFPTKDVSMPDPFTQGLRVEKLQEINGISDHPIIFIHPKDDLSRFGIKKLIDNYLKTPSTVTLKNIISGLKWPTEKEEAGIGFSNVNFNSNAIEALVLYVGMIATVDKSKQVSTSDLSKSNYASLLAGIAEESSVEGRYFLFQAIVDQIRYPNSHTYWFIRLLLNFFNSNALWGSNQRDMQQLITRVLLERVICNKPHPWGLTIIFKELLQNPDYKFFELEFTKATPEIEGMFGSLLLHIRDPGN